MDLRISLLNFNLAMIDISYGILILHKNHVSYLKDNIFKCFFRKYNRLFFFKKIFFTTYSDRRKFKVLKRKSS